MGEYQINEMVDQGGYNRERPNGLMGLLYESVERSMAAGARDLTHLFQEGLFPSEDGIGTFKVRLGRRRWSLLRYDFVPGHPGSDNSDVGPVVGVEIRRRPDGGREVKMKADWSEAGGTSVFTASKRLDNGHWTIPNGRGELVDVTHNRDMRELLESTLGAALETRFRELDEKQGK